MDETKSESMGENLFQQAKYLEEQLCLLGEWNKAHINVDTEQARRNIETMFNAWGMLNPDP